MHASFDTWTSLFLLSAAFGLFLSGIIFSGRTTRNYMLGGIVLGYTLMLTYYVLYWTNYHLQMPWLIAAATGFTYLIGPLFYFFLRSTKSNTYFRWPHLLPFLLVMMYHILFPLFPRQLVPTLITAQDMVQNIHLLIYTALSIHFVLKKLNHKKGTEYHLKRKLTWLFTAYSACFFLYYGLFYAGYLLIEADYSISLASTLIIYYIGYVGYKKPNTLFSKEAPGELYEKSSISPKVAKKICQELEGFMDQSQAYTDGALRLAEVSDKIGFSQHYISQALNRYLKKNFNEYINEKRFQHAKRLLEDPGKVDWRIKEIADKAGFNNKTTFNNTFKKYLGETPKAYREKIRKIQLKRTTTSNSSEH